MPKRRQLRSFDLKQIQGFEGLIGVDEAGRGALAGPVVAGAVLVSPQFLEGKWATLKSGRVNDSKLVTPEDREALWAEFELLAAKGQIHANFGVASVAEIEELNILGATKLAMRRALGGIYPPEVFHQQTEPDLFASAETIAAFQPSVSCRVIVDGLTLRSFPYPHTAFVKGDTRSLAIAMASIVAKVSRDRLMNELDAQFPGYGFGQNKGYGTEEHREAVVRLGRCGEHREMFLRKILSGRSDPGQMDFIDEEGGEEASQIEAGTEPGEV